VKYRQYIFRVLEMGERFQALEFKNKQGGDK